ncbi:hypothetical protein SODALDRAFT_269361 [Sodiomyces alkalinus F11]|uniref:DUF7624 domain-containing protein n=1 Tax=Sodiomyces alkalinus (strain CBS 110278 / VKM F-3762 / F11) TaxID=1314773 RepID=A0A3N2Q6E3_SODAK|nr:hypothetical protein SODALDRAFT_269361 [Sodiomyces alkalinus F11]ROT42277.1 hypothetical protein SODALDRAFT_269361 [Sodiomyces alkalinus F11]
MSVSSPDSEALQSPPFISMSSASPERSSFQSNSLHPDSIQRVSAAMHLMSPSDIVGPSPVTSNGTETTEIEDEEFDEAQHQSMANRTSQPQTSSEPVARSEQTSTRSSPRADTASQQTVTDNQLKSPTQPHPPPLSTDVTAVRYSIDSATPRAQDLEDMLSESSRVRSSSTSSLEKIDEIREAETDTENYEEEVFATPGLPREETEIKALRTALQECWTLCNTLASLSSFHRSRVFHNSGTPDAHEKAWMACWKLCQRLYDNRDQDNVSFSVRESLDLCRDFCQSLFDVRHRKDEVADSILRVNFELSNHLYSAQDFRNIPAPFQERTLEFYITLCHRLMKQRGEVADETDSLLKACWSLAEMLFSLRQNKRDNKSPDEELLGSAVQACWELCDIFRDGWTRVRPDRNTPRPSQTSFFPSDQTNGRESRSSNRSMHSKRESHKSLGLAEERPRNKPPPVPETPVTEFEDTPISPESESPKVPNILVLGTTSDSGRGGRWSSSASNLSSYSQSSAKTSSTATAATAGDDINVTRVKALMLKAAMNVGFVRDQANDGKAGMASLHAFVKQLPAGSFGNSAANTALLQTYRNVVLGDAAFRSPSSILPARGKRVFAQDVAKSVNFMVHRSAHYAFLRDLFRLVFGFPIEESETRKNVGIAI